MATTAALPKEELSSIEYFLSLTDTELEQLQQALARVRAMSPEQRARFREQVLRFRQLPEEEKRKEQETWGWKTEQDRRDWPQMMRSLAPKKRQALQQELQTKAPEEKAQYKHECLERWRKAGKNFEKQH